MPKFSQDWFLKNAKYWDRHIVPSYTGKSNLNFLEIGCFEGRATLWMLENILTNETSKITVMDTFEGSSEHKENGLDLSNLKDIFIDNISEYRNKVKIEQGYSQDILRKYDTREQFDLIYIDGSHHSIDVLEDAVLSFRLLKRGGILAFDDYTWMLPDTPNDRPGIAIEAFMSTHRETTELIHIGWQLFLLKK